VVSVPAVPADEDQQLPDLAAGDAFWGSAMTGKAEY